MQMPGDDPMWRTNSFWNTTNLLPRRSTTIQVFYLNGGDALS